MRLHELAHRLTTDITLMIPREHRRVFVSYILNGFDESGEQIGHSADYVNTLICLDCRNASEQCDPATCEELQRTEKGNE
jgi:hypothetical protein